MELERFFEGIRLMPQAVREVGGLEISEQKYQEMKNLFQMDKEAFYREILQEKNSRLCFLYYYSRMACDTYGEYQKKNIDDKIYWDTFYDITLWCENCLHEFGEYGINEYGWLWRHIEGAIFRLGRLEFERMDSEWNLKGEGIEIKKGDPVISIHIPQGEKLEIAAVKASISQAFQMWGQRCPYICHSWLLYPELAEVLDGKSNILQFQKLFQIVKIDYDEREAESRIYTRLMDNPEKYPENTSLQKRAKQYLLSGKQLGNGMGILKAL